MAEVKFCGLTRPEDAALAAALGATYAGVVFAGGPRRQDVEGARRVWAPIADGPVRRVAVVGAGSPDAWTALASAAGAQVLQLHADVDHATYAATRASFDGEVWPVLRIPVSGELAAVSGWFGVAPCVVLDTEVGGHSGGTGVAFDWATVAASLRRWRGVTRVVVAGGLRPATVAQAVAVLAPDVVDVSSGVESAPGVKDPDLMRTFMDGARATERR